MLGVIGNGFRGGHIRDAAFLVVLLFLVLLASTTKLSVLRPIICFLNSSSFIRTGLAKNFSTVASSSLYLPMMLRQSSSKLAE